jgi:hypothetical protein
MSKIKQAQIHFVNFQNPQKFSLKPTTSHQLNKCLPYYDISKPSMYMCVCLSARNEMK